SALASGFNVFQGTWLESAGPSQIELVVLDWFREWLSYPEGAGGVLTSGGSAANLDALVAARHHAGDPAEPVVYLSDQGHSSLERAARIVGVPAGSIRRVPTDGDFRMDLDALGRYLREDRGRGRTPLCVCANGGATNTGAVDPLEEMAALCREHDVWLHVDAAYGGFAILTEGGRRAFRGIEDADSVTLDPHKWFFQPYETGCLMVREVARLESAFRIFPEYLQDTELGSRHVNFGDRGLQLTRAFRALRIWMSVKTFGMGAFRAAIAEAVDLTTRAGDWIDEAPELELLSPPALGVVCFRFRLRGLGDPGTLERVNLAIQTAVVDEGTAMTSSTRLRGTYALRLCILNDRTRWDDVEATLRRIVELGRREVDRVGDDG
ncbi:MAG TPA: aminotransferase class I/II-fold pyridoxal phosphate-dependent enzyme, partial [Longimicrobiales bacterium]|nr:aminotransferase class I/II-fold pyridoxal phosphate-dependent enzyme [Longimicrobiales bacterium]